jgi:hypothetical protein
MPISKAHERGNNRSSALFVLGLLGAAALAVSMDGWGRFMLRAGSAVVDFNMATNIVPVAPRNLDAQDKLAAQVAWRYFAQNTRPETGFVDSVAGFPSTTLWDLGSYVLALTAAHALGVIDDAEFDARTHKMLESLNKITLFEDLLPNKVYNTITLAMVDYNNNLTERGVGWSAIDIARLLSGLRVLERRQPEYGDQVRGILARWELDAMAYQGELTGAGLEEGLTVKPQEGRIGYEQYAARAAALWGLDVVRAMSAARILEWKTVSGVQVPIDQRSYSAFKTITPTLSEPYFLQGLELGLDSEAKYLATQVYLAQESRFQLTGTPTMVSEDHLNQAPYFLYSTVHSNGEPWAVVAENGQFHNDKRTISTKAVFAWDALYNRPYTNELRQRIANLASQGGWAAGEYENGQLPNDVLTLNTNAVILEAIHYVAFGPLWQVR